MINEKVIDSHLHVEAFENEESDFVNCFEHYREANGLASFNICVVPTKQRNVCNNMMAALYKLAHPNTYAHGGIDHIHWPITTDMPEGMDHVTQYRELMEMGFDGIKMLEAKPSHHKRNGLDLSHPALESVFDAIEQDGTHLILHSNSGTRARPRRSRRKRDGSTETAPTRPTRRSIARPKRSWHATPT